jgi:hypothetical protein
MVEGGGFEPPKLARQIYSLIPLATREPLRKKPGIFIHCPAAVNACRDNLRQSHSPGAGERSRTPDLLITSQLLYQLSYASIWQLKNGRAILLELPGVSNLHLPGSDL